VRPDVLIVGGGVMGSSTAYHLRRADPALSVVVVERDDSYRQASTPLSDGNVRIQFGLEENVRISQHTMEVLATFDDEMATAGHRPDVSARHQGNLFLVDEASKTATREAIEMQTGLGCRVEWLESLEITDRFPGLGSVEGVVGASFGPDDGSVDPGAVLLGYRNKAVELGAEYVQDEVTGLLGGDGRVRGARLRRDGEVTCPIVVATAGAWTADLVRPLGVSLPVVPVMRTVYVVSTTVPTAGMPSVFAPSGVYALPEGDRTWLIAWSRDEDPVGYEFIPASRQRFTDLIWPELYRHLPAFDSLVVESAWAGLYAVNTLDGNAILGEWPRLPGLYLATGFSGHGFQQAPAVGRYLSELILGLDPALDLSRLGGQRVLDGRPVHEQAGRLI
jgi:glycine/D-amino acid oxidase-like deaminating enzyme